MIYLLLAVAITFEVVGTTALKLSDGFTKAGPSILALACYAVAFYCLAVAMRTLPAGIVYAIWSGLGIFLIAIIGWLYLGQSLDVPAVIGLALILAGVLVINMFSRTVVH